MVLNPDIPGALDDGAALAARHGGAALKAAL
jgi:hypothetical protein